MRIVCPPLGLLLLMYVTVHPAAARSSQSDATVNLPALQQQEATVLTIGNRLAIAAAARCPRTTPAIGLSFHDLSQYTPAYRVAARAMFARPDLPAILAVADGSTAARAGIRAGDAVAAVNDVAVPPATDDGLARVERVIAMIEQAATAGPVHLTLIRDGERLRPVFAAPTGCAVRLQIAPDPALDARTNGWLIEPTTGLVDFMHGPDELAAVLAHELAHVILGHRQQIGHVSRKESRASELAADRLGVRLTCRAGYRPAAAIAFWRRMAQHGGGGPSGLGRHPTDRQRIATVEKAVAALTETEGNAEGC